MILGGALAYAGHEYPVLKCNKGDCLWRLLASE